jgi:hypothetical protein
MQVSLPDGTMVEFPDGMSQEEVRAVMRSKFPPPNQVTPEQRNQIGRQELGNPLEAGLIGAGRFATEVGQGIKQKALMAGESMGLVDQGRADQYTQGVNQETGRWNELTEGAGAEDVGYYGAMMAPGMLAPGAGILGTAGLGALETAVMPTEDADWAEFAKQAGLGGLTAGAMRSMPDVYKSFKQWKNNRKLGKIDPDVAALAERGVKVSPDVLNPSTTKTVARSAVDIPVVSDVMRGNPMRADAERVIRELSDANTSGRNIQEAFVGATENLKKRDSELWNQMWDESILPGQNVIKIGEVPVDGEDLVRRLVGTATNKQERKALLTLGELVPFEQGGMTLRGLHQLRSNFAANKGWDDLGLGKKMQRKIYSAISKEMEAVAERNGGVRARNMMSGRIDDSRGMYEVIDQARIPLKEAAGNRVNNTPFVQAVLGNSPDRRTAMKRILADQGAPAVRDQISSDILTAYQKSPQAGAAMIRKLGDSITEFFGKDEAAIYRGLDKFIGNLPKKGMDSLTSGGVSAGVAGLGTAGMGAIPTISMMGLTSAALRRKDVRAMLQKLSTAPQDSKLAQELSKYIGLSLAGEGARQEPMQIDIRQ